MRNFLAASLWPEFVTRYPQALWGRVLRRCMGLACFYFAFPGWGQVRNATKTQRAIQVPEGKLPAPLGHPSCLACRVPPPSPPSLGWPREGPLPHS